MKTILVPTDFSRISQQTIQYLLSFMQDIQTPHRVILLHTYLVPATSRDKLICTNDEVKKKSLEGLKKELNSIQTLTTNPNLIFETLSHLGSLNHVVSHVIQEQKVDLVVMGVDGTNRKDEMMDLSNHVSCPLLIIPFQFKT